MARRSRTRIKNSIELLRHFGILEGLRIAIAVDRGDPLIAFPNQERRYWIAGDQSATYHLTHSVEPLRRLAAFVRPTDELVVDVGAHSGLFAAFAKERAPAAQLLLFEPDPDLRGVVERNLQPGNWRLVQSAIGDSTGRATFHKNRESTQTSSLLRGAVEPYGLDIHSFEVDVTTLDDELKDATKVDVLKIDVQGAESLVISGAGQVLANVRTLLIEVSLLGPDVSALLRDLEVEFGQPTRVNVVAGGADLAFEREVATKR